MCLKARLADDEWSICGVCHRPVPAYPFVDSTERQPTMESSPHVEPVVWGAGPVSLARR